MTVTPGLARLLRGRSFAAVYVAFEAFPRAKGASSHIASMVTALRQMGGPVLLLCCGHGNTPSIQIEDDLAAPPAPAAPPPSGAGSLIIVRHRGHDPNFLQRTVDFGHFVASTLRALGQAPRLLVFRDPWSGAPAQAAWPDTPSIFEVNALPSWELAYTWPAFAHAPTLQAKIADLEWRCLQRTDTILTVSPVTREALVGLGVEREHIVLMPNVADATFFATGTPSAHARSDCPAQILERGRWFGYIGSNHPWQGLDHLLDAWALIHAAWPDVRLFIASGAAPRTLRPLRRRIRHLGLETRAYLHGALSPADLAASLPWLEFTCAPLRNTTRNVVQGCCPVKIVESMAAGTPVLASDLRVSRDLITHGHDGLLLPPAEPRLWATTIRNVLQGPDLPHLGANARQTASERFSRALFAARLSDCLEKVLE